MKFIKLSFLALSAITFAGCSSFDDSIDWSTSSEITNTQSETFFSSNAEREQEQRQINKSLNISRSEQIELALEAAISDKVHPLLMDQPRSRAVYFEFSGHKVADKWDDILTQHANYLLSDASIRLLVAGFTDTVGTAKFNLKLGYKRSDAVCSRLVELGARKEQLTCVSYGESHTADPENNESAHTVNRRVELLY